MDIASRLADHLDDLDGIAALIDRHGPSRLQPELLDRVARRALATGVDPTLVSVFVDPDAPEVVRCRAFGRIHGQLAGAPIRPTIRAAA